MEVTLPRKWRENDDDKDNDLFESEYESTDFVSRTGGIPIIEVKYKGETKKI